MNAPIRRLFGLARPELPRLAGAAGLGTAASLSALALTATSAWLISRAAQQPPVAALMVAVVLVRTFGIGRAALRYCERLSAHDSALRVLAGIRVRCFDAAERLTPGAPGFRDADLATRFVADVEAVPDVLVRGVLPLATAGLTAGGLLVLTALLDPAAALMLFLALGLIAVGIPVLRERVVADAAAEIAVLRGELVAATVDLAAGREEYLVNGAAAARLRALRELDSRLGGANRRAARAAALAEGLSVAVAGAAVAAVCALGIGRVHAGGLGQVWLAVLVLAPLAGFELFAAVPEAVARLRAARPGLRRLFEVLDSPPVVVEPQHPVRLGPGAHTLRLEGVCAGWPGSPDCLHHLDLELPPGRRVAVVGESGAGKSTLAAVLSRFLDPSAGSYLLDDLDVRRCTGDDVRAIVVSGGQNSYLFDSTVRANLAMALPGAADEQLWAALDATGLAGWLRSQPLGLDTPVGPAGSMLSGGQARRVVLARALLADAPVLVLDEPTEHLDPGTAATLGADLRRATAGRSTILITHDLTGLDEFDEILVLSAGRVVQRGRHAELAEVPGPYRDLRLSALRTLQPAE